MAADSKPSRRFPGAVAPVPDQPDWVGHGSTAEGVCRVGGGISWVRRDGQPSPPSWAGWGHPGPHLNIGIPASSLLSQGRGSSKQRRLPVSTSPVLIAGSAGNLAPRLDMSRGTSTGIPTSSICSTRRVRPRKSPACPTCGYIFNVRDPRSGSRRRPCSGVARTERRWVFRPLNVKEVRQWRAWYFPIH